MPVVVGDAASSGLLPSPPLLMVGGRYPFGKEEEVAAFKKGQRDGNNSNSGISVYLWARLMTYQVLKRMEWLKTLLFILFFQYFLTDMQWTDPTQYCEKNCHIIHGHSIRGVVAVVIKGGFGSISIFLMDWALVENHQILIFIAVLINYILL